MVLSAAKEKALLNRSTAQRERKFFKFMVTAKSLKNPSEMESFDFGFGRIADVGSCARIALQTLERMTLLEKQQELVTKLGQIKNAQERFAYVIAQGRQQPEMDA